MSRIRYTRRQKFAPQAHSCSCASCHRHFRGQAGGANQSAVSRKTPEYVPGGTAWGSRSGVRARKPPNPPRVRSGRGSTTAANEPPAPLTMATASREESPAPALDNYAGFIARLDAGARQAHSAGGSPGHCPRSRACATSPTGPWRWNWSRHCATPESRFSATAPSARGCSRGPRRRRIRPPRTGPSTAGKAPQSARRVRKVVPGAGRGTGGGGAGLAAPEPGSLRHARRTTHSRGAPRSPRCSLGAAGCRGMERLDRIWPGPGEAPQAYA
ncbi:hypothetical protein ABIE00_003662 [Arthrobacter sp. OAP107]